MGDIAVENYKKSVTRIVERWKGKIATPAKELVKLDEQLNDFKGKKPPLSDEDKKKLGELKEDYLKYKKQIEKANMELKLDLSLIEPPEKTKANEKELIKLPGFIKDIIEAKGLPIGKNVSIAPSDVDFDLKQMKLKGLSFEITWRF